MLSFTAFRNKRKIKINPKLTFGNSKYKSVQKYQFSINFNFISKSWKTGNKKVKIVNYIRTFNFLSFCTFEKLGTIYRSGLFNKKKVFSKTEKL
jgi:hypothetical protein